MPVGDTIVARASAPGQARRAIIRISGPATASVLATLGIDRPLVRSAAVIRAHLDTGELPLLLLSFRSPSSYTGEDAAELIVPNNRTLVDSMIECMCSVPEVRRAEPGEFTARAYLAGRLTLAEAEGVAAKISAESARQLEAADRVLSGQIGTLYAAWTDRLASTLALVEAGIDFVDQEDVIPIAAAELARTLEELSAELHAALGTSYAGAGTGDRALVVLVGPPNAGKSTLFNALLGRTRAVASAQAGTTRDAIIEPLDLSDAGGVEVDLADLPGLDANATGAIDRAAQMRAHDVISRADVLIACDPAGRFEHVPTGAPVIRVRTKADRHLSTPGPGVCVCALDGWHIPALRRVIAEQCATIRRDDDSSLIPRHRAVVAGALDEINQALSLARTQTGAALSESELIAGRLRAALDLLGQLSGQVSTDDVIGRIFATFCIGK
ncbi:MAG: hypothetical protein D6695_03615 [Planctomycetota bacterium]|nr:MAG: hypothetical protein D6695_03615 [Planctomycetota bacterium]